MITYGQCIGEHGDGRYRIKHDGEWVSGPAYEGDGAEERCRVHAFQFAGGAGRVVSTVFDVREDMGWSPPEPPKAAKAKPKSKPKAKPKPAPEPEAEPAADEAPADS